MVLVPELSLLLHVLGESCSLVIVLRNLLDQLFDSSIMLSNLLLEHFDVLVLVLLGLCALLHLHVTPVLVIIFIFLLRHQPDLVKGTIEGSRPEGLERPDASADELSADRTS